MSVESPEPPEKLRGLDKSEYTRRVVRQKIWRRLNVENQHFMGAIVGREGSGKSHSSLAIARAVDPSFSAGDVYFDPKELLEAFDSDNYSAGNIIVLDEAGVGLGNRSWYEKSQILLNQTLQTVRDDNMGVLFTLPRLEELDSQTRGRLHAFVEMTELHKDKGFALAKWKNVSLTRDGSGREYKKYPRMKGPDGAPRIVERVKIGKPPAELVERYEERKEAFKEELYEEAIAAYDDEDADGGSDPKAIAQQLAEDIEPYVSTNGSTKEPYINKDLIRVDYELSHSDARAVKSILESAFSVKELERFA